jgi:hypothetical protein
MSNSQFHRRLRGVILQQIAGNHERQEHRLDDRTLTAVLEQLQYDVHRDLVQMLLQDLRERGMLSFIGDKNRKTGEISARKIEITPKGRDLLELTISDPAIDVNE